MIDQEKRPIRFSLRAFVWIALPMAALLSACTSMKGSMKVVDDPSRVVSYEYRLPYGFVRIERIEAGAPENSHPFAIAVNALSYSLSRVEVKDGYSTGTDPMFNEAELKEYVPHLVAALAKAGPKEDVTFAVIGKHGILGSFSPMTVTTGRLFARGGQLNVIFGLAQQLFGPNSELAGDNPNPGVAPPPFPPGSRAQASNTGWKLLPKGGSLADGRFDWIALDTTEPPAEKAAGAAVPAPRSAESRYEEVQSRLKALDRLKADGLITQEEYNERRKAILQGL